MDSGNLQLTIYFYVHDEVCCWRPVRKKERPANFMRCETCSHFSESISNSIQAKDFNGSASANSEETHCPEYVG
jgi:hypothetical protein